MAAHRAVTHKIRKSNYKSSKGKVEKGTQMINIMTKWTN